jgi:hypothetical protein
MHANYKIIRMFSTLTRDENMVREWKSQSSQHEHVLVTKLIKEGQKINFES